MKLTTTLFAILLCFMSYGQLVVNDTISTTGLVQSLSGKGITISNFTVNCPDTAYGYFNAKKANINLREGMVMTSGAAASAVGPNDVGGITTAHGNPGDDQLDSLLVTLFSQDACIIEFDIVPSTDSISFRFVYGSDEYQEFVCSGFNDIFGFFISGPGIPGTKNMAVVPGTIDPITINNINGGVSAGGFTPCILTNTAYYVDNGTGAFGTPQFTDTTVIQYDGFTIPLVAGIGNLIPCQTYHLKLAIADAGDGSLDSGVFIEELNSLGLEILTSTTVGNLFNAAVEDCNVDGFFNFELNDTTPVPYIINFVIGGSAQNSIDYVTIPDSVIIQPGDSTVTITIDAIADGILEGTEEVKLYLINPCTNLPFDSAVIEIQDDINLLVSADLDTICTGNIAYLNADGAAFYLWSPSTGLNDPNISNPIASPTVPITYKVQGNLGTCTDSAFIEVYVSDEVMSFDAGPDDSTCINGIVDITPVLIGNRSPYTFDWTPAAGLSNSNIIDPSASPNATTDYTVLVTSSTGCTRVDSITIFVQGIAPLVTVVADQSLVCPGDTVNVTANVMTDFCQPFPFNCGFNFNQVLAGSGGIPNSNVSPYQGAWQDVRLQMMYRASELTGWGMTPGVITDLAFTITSKASTASYDNFTIKMGCTDSNALGNEWIEDLTFVKNPYSFTSAMGTNNHNLDLPYEWDGLSNIVIEICYDNNNAIISSTDPINTHTTTFNSTLVGQTSFDVGCNLPDFFAVPSMDRPDLNMIYCVPDPPVYTYVWDDLFDMTITDTFMASRAIDSTYTFRFNVDDGFCEGAGEITVNVDTNFRAVAIRDTVLCEFVDIQLNSTVNGRVITPGFTFEWSPSTDLDNVNIQNPVLSPTQNTYELGVTITSPINCIEYDSISILINPVDIDTVFGDTCINQRESVGLVSNLIEGIGTIDYIWSPNFGLSWNNASSTIATPDSSTTYTLIATATDGSGCSDTINIDVKVTILEEIVALPKAFSPNGDGLNDFFGPLLNENLELQKMRVYNRWGELVFESNSEFWDGGIAGLEQPVGTYVYYIELVNYYNEVSYHHGTVSLLR